MSGDDGLREAVAREYAEFQSAPAAPEQWELDNGEDFAAGLLAVPEVAALRAKAAAADRVRELAEELDADAERAYQRSCGHRDEGSDGQYRAYEDAADRIRAALDGDAPC